MTVTVQLMGGLGNQLFQIFTTLTYASKNGHKVVFLASDKLGDGIHTTQRTTYWNTLFKSLTPFLTSDYSKIAGIAGQITVRETGFTYDHSININYNPNYLITLIGYFQSYKYFQSHIDTIIRMLNFRILRARVISNIKIPGAEHTVAIHFRLGDYKKYPKYHPILSTKYYINALLYILNTVHKTKSPNNPPLNVICFYDKSDADDIITIKNTLTHIREVFFESDMIIHSDIIPHNVSDWEELLLMSSCRHHVIANSSFSWWGAYLADSLNDTTTPHLVCYPSTWFGIDATHNTRDLFPTHWHNIDS